MNESIIVELPDQQMKKHSVRYDSKDGAVTSIYIKKDALDAQFGAFPKGVRITIESLD